MEAIGDYCVTNDKILDGWHCPLGVDFAPAVGDTDTNRLHAMFAIHVFLKHRRVQSFYMLVVWLRCAISSMLSSSSKCCWRACSDET